MTKGFAMTVIYPVNRLAINSNVRLFRLLKIGNNTNNPTFQTTIRGRTNLIWGLVPKRRLNVNTRVLNTLIPNSDNQHAMRHWFARLRHAPTILDSTNEPIVQPIRIDVFVQSLNKIVKYPSETLAKRPRLRTRVPTNSHSVLEPRRRIRVTITRLRHLHRRIDLIGRHITKFASVHPCPTSLPHLVTVLPTKKYYRRELCHRHASWVGTRANPLILRSTCLHRTIGSNNARTAINRRATVLRNVDVTVNLNQNFANRTISARIDRLHVNRHFMLTRTNYTLPPTIVHLTMRHRLAGLRMTPLIFKSAHSDVNGVRINTNMRININIGNTANAKRPRLRTRVPTNNTTALELRRRIFVNVTRLRHLDRRITTVGRNHNVVTRMCLSPARGPITLNNNVPREKDHRRINGRRTAARVMTSINPTITGLLLLNNNMIARNHSGKTVNRFT